MIKTITDGSYVTFESLVKEYGRMEFVICATRKKFVITSKQREELFQAELLNPPKEITLGSFNNLSPPQVWRLGWCKEHKTQFTELYVPDNSICLQFNIFSFCLNLDFRKFIPTRGVKL